MIGKIDRRFEGRRSRPARKHSYALRGGKEVISMRDEHEEIGAGSGDVDPSWIPGGDGVTSEG